MSYLDIIILSVIGISTILAFFRGIITEFLSLLVWFFAFYIASNFSGSASEMLSAHVDDPFRSLFAFGLTFLAALFVGGIINILLTMLFRFFKISFFDRGFGAIFGFLRGWFIIGMVSLLLSGTPLRDPQFVSKIIESSNQTGAPPALKVLSNLLKQNSKFSRYAVMAENVIVKVVPKRFLEQMDTKKLLNHNESESLPVIPPEVAPIDLLEENP